MSCNDFGNGTIDTFSQSMAKKRQVVKGSSNADMRLLGLFIGLLFSENKKEHNVHLFVFQMYLSQLIYSLSK